MTTLLQGAYGGSVRLTSARRIEADYPHLFITVLMCFPVLLFGLGATFAAAGVIANGQAIALIPVVMGGAASAALGALVRYRWRSMGAFVLDAEAAFFARLRGGSEVDRYPLDAIRSVQRRWDVLHRGFILHYWLIVETTDGRSFRVGKGPRAEVDRTLRLLRSWGLP